MRYRARNRVCAMPDCDKIVHDRSTYCGLCAQRLRFARQRRAAEWARLNPAARAARVRRQMVQVCEAAERRVT